MNMFKTHIFKKTLAAVLSVLMCLSFMPLAAFADGETETENYLEVIGINGFESEKFASFEAAYTAIKPVLATLGGLTEETTTVEKFDDLFTDVDENGDATLTYKIHGSLTYDETNCPNLISMGRGASHYITDTRHLIKFVFEGADADRASTLTVNSRVNLPYEWWGEKKVTSLHLSNLTVKGQKFVPYAANNGCFEALDFAVDNCNFCVGIHDFTNVPGTVTVTNSTFNGTDASANDYAIHIQGHTDSAKEIVIKNNKIFGYDRGINIDQKTAKAVISENEISIKDSNRSCVQLTQLATVDVTGNKLVLTGGNAITLHSGLLSLTAVPTVNISGNNITGNGYLIYDGGKDFTDKLNLTLAGNRIANTVDKTSGVYNGIVTDLSETVRNAVDNPADEAMIGEVKYASLQDAFNAAKKGDTVKLLSDITLKEQVNILSALDGLTLDGNGKTIICETTTDPSQSGGSALYFGNATSKKYCTGIKIKNLTMTGKARFAIFLCGGTTSELTNVNISGEYLYAINFYGTHGATMTNCDISNSFVAPDNNNEGGAAVWTNVASANPLVLNNTRISVIAINKYASVNTLAPKIFVNEGSETEVHTLDDGTVSGNKKLCVSSESKGSYSVKEYVDNEWVNVRVASVTLNGNTTYYESLQAAVAAAGEGATVKLLADVTADVVLNKNIILDLNGKTLTGTGTKGKATLTVENGAVVTVKNGSVIGTENTYYNIQNNGTATFEDITATAGNTGSSMIDNFGILNIKSGSYTGGLNTVKNEAKAELNITGGTFELTYYTSGGYTGVIYNYGNLNISAGSFTQSSTGTLGYQQVIFNDLDTDVGVAPRTEITGGKFVNKNSRSTAWTVRAHGSSINDSFIIKGGIFNKKVSEYYCTDGYIQVRNSDGTYGFVEVHPLSGITVKRRLTLGNSLTMTYRVAADEYTPTKIVFSFYDATEDDFVDTTVSKHTVDGGYYNFDFAGINPQRMNDTLKAVIYFEKDGVVYSYTADDYSVKDYCVALLKSDKTGAYKEIIGNLLEYGAKSQIYANYRTDALVTDAVKAEGVEYTAVSYINKSVKVIDKTEAVEGGVTLTTKSLVLNNSVAVRVYFTLDSGVSKSKVRINASVIQDGKVIRSQNFSGSAIKYDSANKRYYIEYNGIMATEFDNEIVFTSYVSKVQNDVLHYNVNNYLKAQYEKLNSDTNADLKNLIDAVFSYAYTCDHFNK